MADGQIIAIFFLDQNINYDILKVWKSVAFSFFVGYGFKKKKKTQRTRKEERTGEESRAEQKSRGEIF